MGVYWTFVCDEAAEFINPHGLKDQGAKIHEILGPKFGMLCLFALSDRWSDREARLVPEFDEYEYEQRGYRDVTRDVIEDFNKDFGEGDKQIEVEAEEDDPKYDRVSFRFEEVVVPGKTVEVGVTSGLRAGVPCVIPGGLGPARLGLVRFIDEAGFNTASAFVVDQIIVDSTNRLDKPTSTAVLSFGSPFLAVKEVDSIRFVVRNVSDKVVVFTALMEGTAPHEDRSE